MSSKHEDDDELLAMLGRHIREGSEEMEAITSGPLRPLDEDEQQNLQDGVLARLGLATAQSEPSEAPGGPATAADESRPAKVVSFSARRRTQPAWPLFSGALAVAAAAALLWWPPGADESLPPYVLVAPGSDAQFRGEGPHARRPGHAYTLGRELEVVLRPSTRVSAAVEARVFLLEGEVGKTLDVRSEQVPGGGVVLYLRTGEGTTLSEPGGRTLRIVIGPEGELPEVSPPEPRRDAGSVQWFDFSFQLLQ